MVVLVLVVIDLVILILYTLIELGRDNLSATRLENRENPVDVKGVSVAKIYQISIVHLNDVYII